MLPSFDPFSIVILIALGLFFIFIYLFIRRTITGFREGLNQGRR